MNLPKPKFKDEQQRRTANSINTNLLTRPKVAPPPGMSFAVAETIAK